MKISSRIRFLAAIVVPVVVISVLLFRATPPETKRPDTSAIIKCDELLRRGDVVSVENSSELSVPILDTKARVGIERLPRSSQKSLWDALSKARHAVAELSDREAAMPRNAGVRYFASQPEHEFTARFLDDGSVRLQPGYAGATWEGTLRLAGGEAPALRQAGNARVELRHSEHLVEWYENKPEGLEHGFTVQTPLADMNEAEGFQLAIQVEGMRVEADPERPGDLVLADRSGEALLGYQNLKVWDADRRQLEAEMRPSDDGILLVVNDTDARYPLTIDPVINRIAHMQRLEPTPDLHAEANDHFGCSVDISGDTVVVGTKYRDTPAGTNAGCAYVFTRNGSTWSHQQQISAYDAAADDQFGGAVSIEVDWVAVGAAFDDHQTDLPGGSTTTSPDAGSVYTFVRSGGIWSPKQRLWPSSGGMENHFGSSLDISGDSLVVGIPGQNAVGLRSGAAYVFTRSGEIWSEQQQLTASQGGDDDEAGTSVAISGDTVVMGSGYHNRANVYVRSAGVWSEQALLTPPSGGAGFGRGVSVSADTIAVGAYYDDSVAPYSHSGSVFVFTRSGVSWSLQQKLVASDADGYTGEFGSSVSLDGDTLVASAANTWGNSPCYVFTRSGVVWSEQQKLTDCGSSFLAGTVAISGDTLIVGAENEQSSEGRAYVYARGGSTWTRQAELEAGQEPLFGDEFGIALDMKGGYALVGAWGDDTAVGTDAGSVYLCTYGYDSGTSSYRWKISQKVTAPDAAPYDRFGSSVAFTDGEWLDFAVGAVGDDVWAGSAYVFIPSSGTWVQQQKLLAGDRSSSEFFGESIDMSGESVVVGASNDGVPTADHGAAYVFSRSGSTWTEQQKLTASDATDGSAFGYSVALEGDTVVIGDFLDDHQERSDCGSAYAFTRSGSVWSLQAKLLPLDSQSDYEFGRSLALSQGTLIVGAPGAFNTPGYVTGAAYIFTTDGVAWTQQQKLEASDGASGDEFGVAVSIDTDAAMVGAWEDDTAAGVDAGSAYLFVRTSGTWAQEDQFFGSAPSAGAAFGNAVANTQSRAMVGAYLGDATDASGCGTVDVFEMERIMLTTTELMEGLPRDTRIGGVSVHSSRSGWTVTVPQGFEENHMFYTANALWFGPSLYPYYTFDHEEQATRTIRLRATLGGESFDDVFVISILDDRSEDFDGDGLTEAQEEDTYGTSDLNPDDDNDGIPGGTEVAVGLDPAVDNSNLVNAIQSKPEDFGVDMNALSLGQPVLKRDAATGTFTLTLDLQKSTDLSTFSDMQVSGDDVSVNAEGDVEVEFTSPEDAAFFRIEGR